jgi:transposase-like protein
MPINCPNLKCVSDELPSPKSVSVVRHGSYFRTSDSRSIARFYCKLCKKSFSRATLRANYFQKKRRINEPLFKLYCSAVSQRRAAKILNVNLKTVARRFKFLKSQACLDHEKMLAHYQKHPLTQIQFDDLETSEHTKCKPLSVTLAVDPKTRKILNFQVNQMPAKGLLAAVSRKKYGVRIDERSLGWNQMMLELKKIVSSDVEFLSDENPHYPKYVFKHHPGATHKTTKGGRGAITGQGELKKLRFDPLFALNHTCAMLRANMNRLFRRTWCTTKTRQGLIDHLWLYVKFHNQALTKALSKQQA